MESLVSIITPLYNAEKYIGETIESVLNQSYKNWEMLIIDDSSKDNSLKIAKKYEVTDKRIKVIKNEKNLGVTKTRNKGITLAKGKFIAFLDADDLWKSEKLKKQIFQMEKEDAIISHSSYDKINEDGSYRGTITAPKIVRYVDSLKGNIMGCLTVVYNQEKIGKKYFRELEMSEDHVLWLDILKNQGSSLGIEESLSKYRVLGESRSSNKINAIKFQWKINREIEKLNLFESYYYFTCYLWSGFKRYKV